MQKRRIFSLIAMIGLVISLSAACSTGSRSKVSKETVFDFYNKVQMDQTKAQVDAVLGVAGKAGTQLANSFTYTDPNTGYGVSVVYGDKNTVTSKTLFYLNREDLAFLFSKKVTQAQADKITKGMTYDQIKTLLGVDGIEVSSTQIPFNDNKLSSINIWVNPDGSMIQVVLGTDGTSNDAIFFD